MSVSVCVTLIRADPTGSPAQAARRAIAARMQAERVPGGGVQSSSSLARSRNGRSADVRSGRLVVAQTGVPCACKSRLVAAPISESPPIKSFITRFQGSSYLVPLRGARDRGSDLLSGQSIDLEQFLLHAVFVWEGVRQADAHQRRHRANKPANQYVGHRAAEAADHGALLDHTLQ